jgi:hypothetical protein
LKKLRQLVGRPGTAKITDRLDPEDRDRRMRLRGKGGDETAYFDAGCLIWAPTDSAVFRAMPRHVLAKYTRVPVEHPVRRFSPFLA